MSTATSNVWKNLTTVPGTPAGFTMRGAVPAGADGVEVMLEAWEAGTAEPPHSHPGDDMTVVIEGRMEVQFYVREGEELEVDGAPIVLSAGETGYVSAGRIHEVRYVEACRLVYVHDRLFGFDAEK